MGLGSRVQVACMIDYIEGVGKTSSITSTAAARQRASASPPLELIIVSVSVAALPFPIPIPAHEWIVCLVQGLGIRDRD